MPKVCPRCRLTHPATATRCECGADLYGAPVIPSDEHTDAGRLQPHTISARGARTAVNLAGAIALVFLTVCPPWVVTQHVRVLISPIPDRIQNAAGGPRGREVVVTREVAQLGHQWWWTDAGCRPSVASVSLSGPHSSTHTLSDLAAALDWRLLLAELAALAAGWGLLLRAFPK